MYDWIVNPSTGNAAEADITCLEELLELKYDEESQSNLNNGGYLKLCDFFFVIHRICTYVENDI